MLKQIEESATVYRIQLDSNCELTVSHGTTQLNQSHCNWFMSRKSTDTRKHLSQCLIIALLEPVKLRGASGRLTFLDKLPELSGLMS